MKQLHAGLTLRQTTEADFTALAPTMRQEDRDEIEAVTGLQAASAFRDHLRKSYRGSQDAEDLGARCDRGAETPPSRASSR
jgi:hypothetical protein